MNTHDISKEIVPLTPEKLKEVFDEICNLALSISDLSDDNINDQQNVTVAQQIAVRTMAKNIGALADFAGGGGWCDQLEWLGIKAAG